jgi:hypothetical protein
VISFNYQLPIGKGRALGVTWARLSTGLVGGWEVSGILTFSSGYPIIPGLESGTLWEGTQRPNYIGDPGTAGKSTDERLNAYFNVDAFPGRHPTLMERRAARWRTTVPSVFAMATSPS